MAKSKLKSKRHIQRLAEEVYSTIDDKGLRWLEGRIAYLTNKALDGADASPSYRDQVTTALDAANAVLAMHKGRTERLKQASILAVVHKLVHNLQDAPMAQFNQITLQGHPVQSDVVRALFGSINPSEEPAPETDPAA